MLLFLEEQAQFVLHVATLHIEIYIMNEYLSVMYALLHVCISVRACTSLLSSHLKLSLQLSLIPFFPPPFHILGRNFPAQEIVQVHDLENIKYYSNAHSLHIITL